MLGFVFSSTTTATLGSPGEGRGLAVAFHYPRFQGTRSRSPIEFLRGIGVGSSPIDA